MKNNRSLINGLVAGAVALAMASTLTAQTVTQVKAKVVRIKGFARFSTGNAVRQNLKVGRIFGNVKKLSAASKYNIKLPSGIAGIRGTVYSIGADGTVKVSSGSVVIAFVSADGKATALEVKAGQQFDPRAEPGSQIT